MKKGCRLCRVAIGQPFPARQGQTMGEGYLAGPIMQFDYCKEEKSVKEHFLRHARLIRELA